MKGTRDLLHSNFLVAPYRPGSSFRATSAPLSEVKMIRVLSIVLTRSAGVLVLLKVVKEPTENDIVFVYVIRSG